MDFLEGANSDVTWTLKKSKMVKKLHHQQGTVDNGSITNMGLYH